MLFSRLFLGGIFAKKLKMNYKNDKTFNDGFEEFILNCRSRNLREGTIKHYQESYNQIIKYFDEDILLSDISKKVFEEFILRVGKNKNMYSQTLYIYSRDLKTIINFFINLEYTPMFKIVLPRVDKYPIETYSDEELEKLLKKPNLKKCEFTEL